MSKYPKLPSNVGKRGELKMPLGEVRKYTIVGEVRRTQAGAPHKKICFQKVEFDDGRKELRLAYYIIGKKGRMKRKWVFGQFATFMPARDFRSIVRRAKRKGLI